MVMNEATDIAFYSVDSQLRHHLYRRMEILENSAGQRVREGRERERGRGRECIFPIIAGRGGRPERTADYFLCSFNNIICK